MAPTRQLPPRTAGFRRTRLWALVSGPGLVLAVVLLAEAMRVSGVDTPARLALLPTAVGLAAYLGGLYPGLVAAALAGLYAVYVYVFPGGDLRSVSSILLWLLSIAGMALLVGIPREAAERERARALRAAALETEVTLARAAVANPTLEATLRSVLQAAVRLTSADAGSLFLIDRAGAVTHSAVTSDRPQDQLHDVIERVMLKGLSGWAVRNARAALVLDTRGDDRWLRVDAESDKTRSALAVPVMDADAVAGVMTLVHGRPAHFGADHLALLQSAGEQLALAVRNAQAFDENVRHARRQTILNEVLRAVGGWFGADAVAQSAAATIRKVTEWPRVSIAVPSRDQRRWIVYAPRGMESPAPAAPLEAGLLGNAFSSGHTRYVADLAAEPVPGEDRLVGSALAVPLQTGSRVTGVLKVESDATDAFGQEDIALAESLAEAIALALDNTRLYQTIAGERSQLKALIESTREGIVLIDPDGVLRVVNGLALQWLRLPGRADDWLGRPIADVAARLRGHAPGVARTALAEVRRNASGNASAGEGEFDLKPFVVHWLNLPVVAGATPLGRLLILRNVTEQRQIERAREDLVHTMVHDLRNPLNSICIALSLLMQHYAGAFSSDQHKVLSMASEAAQNMLQMVNGILDVSRLESGSLTPQFESVALAAVVDEVLKLEAPQAAENGLCVENQVSPDLPRVWADPALLRRILENLVGNAVKFTPPGGRVRIAASTELPGMTLITVSDTGLGIPVELQGRLFQKFAAGGQPAAGTGLGLAFCQLAVKAHGGRIWVDSPPGQGTTFSILLPNPAE